MPSQLSVRHDAQLPDLFSPRPQQPPCSHPPSTSSSSSSASVSSSSTTRSSPSPASTAVSLPPVASSLTCQTHFPTRLRPPGPSSPDDYPIFPLHPQEIQESRSRRPLLSLSLSENILQGIGSIFQTTPPTPATVTSPSSPTAQETLQAIWNREQVKIMQLASPNKSPCTPLGDHGPSSPGSRRFFWFSDRAEENVIDDGDGDPDTDDDEYNLHKLIQQSLAVRKRSRAYAPIQERGPRPHWTPPPPGNLHILQPQPIDHPHPHPPVSVRACTHSPPRGTAASSSTSSSAKRHKSTSTPMSPISPLLGESRWSSRRSSLGRAGRPVIYEHVAEMNALEHAENHPAPFHWWFRPGILRRWTISSPP